MAGTDDGTVDYPSGVPELTDGVVTLRPYLLDDVPWCVEQCADPDTLTWITVPVPYTRDDAVEWVRRTVPRGWTDQSDLAFAIQAAHPDGVSRYSGGVSLRPRRDGVAEIGFGLHPAVRGQGLCRRAVALLLDWAFAERDVEVALWYAGVGNWRSRRVAWASGFSFDGTIAKFLAVRGVRQDAWAGSLRRGDDRGPKHAWFVPPVLGTPRLRLRPMSDLDADRLAEMINDGRSRHFGGHVSLPEEGAALLHRMRERQAVGQSIDWCIADRETDQLLGEVQLFGLDRLDGTEVMPGYVIHPDARGRGVLTEALRAVVEWTFRPVDAGGFGKRRITIETAASNAASRYAALRAGFAHVATVPQAFPMRDGFDDLVIYQRLNVAWRASLTPRPA